MRRRSLASIVAGPSEETCVDDTPGREQIIADFQAEHTEKSAARLLSVMRVVVALWLPVLTVHVFSSGLSAQGAYQALPRLLIWGLLCGNRQYLENKMKSYPIVVATGVQCIGHLTAAYGMVSTSLHMPKEIQQHRMFLSQFFPMYLFAASTLYIPMRVYVMFVCPLYSITWLIFHASVGWFTGSVVVYSLCLTAVALYVRHSQTEILWQEFQASRAVQEERNVSKAMQESFRGILSTIFDSSCTCTKSGQLRELSPQLQELLGFTDLNPYDAQVSTNQEMAYGLNLSYFAATDAEAARVQSFLASVCSGGRSQASKIQCSFRRRGTCSSGVIDVHMLAIALEDSTHARNHAGSLFVVFESLTPEVIQQDALVSTLPSAESIGALPDEVCSGDAISDCVRSALGTNDDSLIYSITDCVSSANQLHAPTSWNTEAQAVTVPVVSVGVQTISSSRQPPLPDTDKRLQEPLHARALGGRFPRIRGRVFTKNRCKILPSYAVTPNSSIRSAIFVNLLLAINPVCSRGCCMYHTVLNFLRQELTSMLKSSTCNSWDTEDMEQCAACFFLQPKEDEEDQFECSNCASDRMCSQSDSEMSSTSSSRNVGSVCQE